MFPLLNKRFYLSASSLRVWTHVGRLRCGRGTSHKKAPFLDPVFWCSSISGTICLPWWSDGAGAENTLLAGPDLSETPTTLAVFRWARRTPAQGLHCLLAFWKELSLSAMYCLVQHISVFPLDPGGGSGIFWTKPSVVSHLIQRKSRHLIWVASPLLPTPSLGTSFTLFWTHLSYSLHLEFVAGFIYFWYKYKHKKKVPLDALVGVIIFCMHSFDPVLH